jgi:hypothetical protein
MSAEPQAVLLRYPLVCRPVGTIEALGDAGGRSGSRWWRFDTPGGRLGLRAWPPPPLGPSPARLDTIHGWLAEAGTLSFVPRPLPGLDGRTCQLVGGRGWELLPWLDGQAEPSPYDHPARIDAGFHALARFHREMARGGIIPGSSPNVETRLEELERLRSGGFDKLSRAVMPAHDLAPLIGRWRWLAERLAPRCMAALRGVVSLRVPLQPCVRDLRGEHLLFDGDSLRGLDSVATDLARLTEDWLGADLDATRRGLSAYEAVRPLDTTERRLIGPLAQSSALLAGANWIKWGLVEHRKGISQALWVSGVMRSLDRLAVWAGETGNRPPIA